MRRAGARHRRLSPIPFAPILFALVLPACFDLQKVDPGPRVIDDFADGGLTPAWNHFDPWTCGTFVGTDQYLGQDGGEPDGASLADPDGSARCQSVSPGDDDPYALQATFELNQPPDDTRQAGAAAVTRTTPGTTVDLTGFAQLWFSAYLESTPALLPLTDAQFQVELGCSNNLNDPIAFQVVDMSLLTGSWPLLPIQLSLDAFRVTKTTHSQDCLRQVDSLHFTIIPQLAPGTSTGGTFHLDNISLQN